MSPIKYQICEIKLGSHISLAISKSFIAKLLLFLTSGLFFFLFFSKKWGSCAPSLAGCQRAVMHPDTHPSHVKGEEAEEMSQPLGFWV